MKLKQHIPNAITCLNLFCGCLSIMFLMVNMPIKAAIMIFVAGLFDLLDGLAARLLDVHSPIGRQLDSLADVVSFGVAPGFIMFYFMEKSLVNPYSFLWGIPVSLAYLAFLLPMFAAIRLARFNVDDTQTTDFRGLPAPAMALFVASLPLALIGKINQLHFGSHSYWAILGITLIFAFMMVSSRLRFFSFKMKSLSWKGHQLQWIFLILAVVGFAIFRFPALPFIMLLYILMSILFYRPKAEPQP